MLTRGTAVKSAHAKRNVYHSHWDFHTHASKAADIEIDCNVSDSVPDQTQLDAYFSLIDIKQCNVPKLQAYAAHQK